MAVHVRFESWDIFFAVLCKMSKFYVFWRARTAMANFRYLPLQLNAVGAR